MKNDNKMEKDNKELRDISAISKEDGMIFYSSFVEVETTTSEDRTVKVEVRPRHPLEMFFGMVSTKLADSINIREVKTFEVNLVTCVLLLLSILGKNPGAVVAVILLRFTMLRNLLNVVCMSFQMKLGKSKSLGRYHAAEHMAVNAYNDLGRAPTLEEVRTYSRFDENCGSMREFRKIISVLPQIVVLCFCTRIYGIAYIICVIVASAIAVWGMDAKVKKYLQILITNKPTDIELKNAVEGIKKLEETLNDMPSYDIPRVRFIGGIIF